MQQLAVKMTPEQRRQAATGTLPKKTAAATPTAPAAAPVVAAAPAAPVPGTEATPAIPEVTAPLTTDDDAQPAGNPAEVPAGGEKGNPTRFRFNDEKDQAVAMYAKAHGVSLIEAAKRLDTASAIQPAAAAPAAPAEAEPDHELAAVDKRISDTQTRIAELTAARKKANEDLDNEKAYEISDEIAALKANAVLLDHEKKGLLSHREHQALSSRQEQLNASRDRAFVEYPELADTEGKDRLSLEAFIARAKEDPKRKALFQTPTWPEVIVQEFATKFGMKPKSAAGTAPVATSAAATPAPNMLRKPAPVQAAATPEGARLLTSAGGHAPNAPKPMTMEEAKAKLRADPKLGAAVFKHLGQKRS